MKKSQEIIGLPVFSIVDGRKIGQVKDLVINPEEGKVDFLMVSNGSWYVGAKVLPFTSVIGIGEHAVTTESEGQLAVVSENPSANALLQRNIEVKGNRVLTNKGNLIGIIVEYEIDENAGQILRIEYRSALDEKTMAIIEAGNILTYGSDIVVVREASSGSEPPSGSQEPVAVLEQPAPADIDSPSMELAEEAPPEDLIVTEQPDTGEISSADEAAPVTDSAALFKEKQKQYLIGRKVTKSIKDADGNVIIADGSVIDEAMIVLAEQYNRFIELSQSAK